MDPIATDTVRCQSWEFSYTAVTQLVEVSWLEHLELSTALSLHPFPGFGFATLNTLQLNAVHHRQTVCFKTFLVASPCFVLLANITHVTSTIFLAFFTHALTSTLSAGTCLEAFFAAFLAVLAAFAMSSSSTMFAMIGISIAAVWLSAGESA